MALSRQNTRGDEIRQDIELMFFAYRAFTRDVDSELEKIGLGRAHHRVLHFVHSRPYIIVGDLLAILDVSKQSLNRVMRDLQEREFITTVVDQEDKRRRRLKLTPKGARFADTLTKLQRERFVRGYRSMTPDVVNAWRRVLESMLDEEERLFVYKVIGRGS